MYRVQLGSASNGTGVSVLSPTPYPDETWEWLQQEAENEAVDGRYGPARRRLDRLKRERVRKPRMPRWASAAWTCPGRCAANA
jgi:hypothetical protein